MTFQKGQRLLLPGLIVLLALSMALKAAHILDLLGLGLPA